MWGDAVPPGTHAGPTNGGALAEVRRTLWAAADQLRTNSTLAPNEYRGPVLGLIFLAYAEHRFEQIRPELEAKATARRKVSADDYRARSVLFLPEAARLSSLVGLPEGDDLGAAVDGAMKAVETTNPARPVSFSAGTCIAAVQARGGEGQR